MWTTINIVLSTVSLLYIASIYNTSHRAEHKIISVRALARLSLPPLFMYMYREYAY